MVELICERGLCKHCTSNKCNDEKIKEEFKRLTSVSKVILSVDSNSCKRYEEDEFLIDPLS